MMTIHRVLHPSPRWSFEKYDNWYLGQHTNYGKKSPDIVCYRALSRAGDGGHS